MCHYDYCNINITVGGKIITTMGQFSVCLNIMLIGLMGALWLKVQNCNRCHMHHITGSVWWWWWCWWCILSLTGTKTTCIPHISWICLICLRFPAFSSVKSWPDHAKISKILIFFSQSWVKYSWWSQVRCDGETALAGAFSSLRIFWKSFLNSI